MVGNMVLVDVLVHGCLGSRTWVGIRFDSDSRDSLLYACVGFEALRLRTRVFWLVRIERRGSRDRRQKGKLPDCLAQESGGCSVHRRCSGTVECLQQVVRCSVVAAILARFVCTVAVL